MDDSDLAAFAPAPVRARADGWTVERQTAFIRLLEGGLRPGPAARRVGMSRQTAYALRGRPGAESFAAAWDAALATARRARARPVRPGPWERALEGELRPVIYRGRIIAMDRKYDARALIRLLGQAVKILEKPGA